MPLFLGDMPVWNTIAQLVVASIAIGVQPTTRKGN
jgi:hypothetical protein